MLRVFFLFFSILCFGQQKQFNISWSGVKVLETDYGKLEVPGFDAKHFNYDDLKGLVFFAQQGARGNFSDIVILDFFFSFLSMGFIPMIFISLICLPIKIFSKISTGKLLFWTSIILGMANVLNGTFS